LRNIYLSIISILYDNHRGYEGNQVGWLSAASISQTLSDTLQASTKYTLSLNVGRWENSPTTNYTVVLWAGGTPLGSISKALSTIPDNKFVEETITYTSPATVTAGQQLKIQISNGIDELDFDNIRLDATPVPVPPSLWLLGSGLVGLVVLRKKFTAFLKK
jgi:hapalindole H/12-epi-hapalindole U/12-epi-fischerindole U synthase